MNRLAGKRALITGGTTGIGFATARLFAEQGASVMLTGRNDALLEAARRQLGPTVLAVRSDATSASDLESLEHEIKGRWDGLDILFLNAGTARVAPLEQVSSELFDELIALNLKAPLFTVQRLLPLLRPGASVILNTSVAAYWSISETSVYSASKAGLKALMRQLAIELAPRAVRVNAVCPGLIETPIYENIGVPADRLQALGEALASRTLLGRAGRAEEVAAAVLFLASADSSYVCGEELVVDGGMLMR